MIFLSSKIDLFVQYEFGISKAFDIDNPKKYFKIYYRKNIISMIIES
ncbi:hypothetical protein BSPWISOXPB_4352 [uncultured Gammaproteobacteria bacterium]|nr:hypothetical protein BSPWISOXPB_4352 [uncultured Gammaproteobacteria bacterium]